MKEAKKKRQKGTRTTRGNKAKYKERESSVTYKLAGKRR
jgi:hypothetical protein